MKTYFSNITVTKKYPSLIQEKILRIKFEKN
jgi:hypothetical protein